MDRSMLQPALGNALRELGEAERLIKALCDEYRRTVRIPWLALYWQERRPGAPIQGPFWARLRRVNLRGQSTIIKDYLGTHLTRRTMYALGVLREGKILEEFDRKAAKLRDRRNRIAASLDRMRKLLRPFMIGSN